MKTIVPLVLACVVFFSGCIADQRNSFMPPQQDPLYSNPSLAESLLHKTPIAEIVPLSPSDDRAVKGIEEIRNQTTASNNQNQQNFSGLGAQIAKVAETMQGFGGDLAHVNASMQNSLNATAQLSNAMTAQASINAQATANLRAQINSDISASVSATLHNELNTALTANASMTNQAIGKMQQTIDNSLQIMQLQATAGRDAIQTTTQFSKEMRDTLVKSYDSMIESEKSTNRWNYWTTVAFIGMIGTTVAACFRALGRKDKLLMEKLYQTTEQSRQRAEDRHQKEKLRADRLTEEIIPVKKFRAPLPSEEPVLVVPPAGPGDPPDASPNP